MLTGKQRSYLRSLANGLDAAVYIGKDDITNNVLMEIDRYLEAHEMVKVKIQEGSVLEAKPAANEIAAKVNAEFVQAIGRRFTLYRAAKNPADRKIELPR